MTSDLIYQWQRQGRRPATVWAVVVTFVAAALLWAVVEAHWAVWAIAFVLSAPALWDLWRNPAARIEVHPQRIVWVSALRSGDRSNIDHVRLDRRFDGGLRITLIHGGGSHTRLPPDVAPPVDDLHNALAVAGISAERHPFSVF